MGSMRSDSVLQQFSVLAKYRETKSLSTESVAFKESHFGWEINFFV